MNIPTPRFTKVMRAHISRWVEEDGEVKLRLSTLAAAEKQRRKLTEEYRLKRVECDNELEHEVRRLNRTQHLYGQSERIRRISKLMHKHTCDCAKLHREMFRKIRRLDTSITNSAKALGRRRGYLFYHFRTAFHRTLLAEQERKAGKPVTDQPETPSEA